MLMDGWELDIWPTRRGEKTSFGWWWEGETPGVPPLCSPPLPSIPTFFQVCWVKIYINPLMMGVQPVRGLEHRPFPAISRVRHYCSHTSALVSQAWDVMFGLSNISCLHGYFQNNFLLYTHPGITSWGHKENIKLLLLLFNLIWYHTWMEGVGEL